MKKEKKIKYNLGWCANYEKLNEKETNSNGNQVGMQMIRNQWNK